MEARARPSFVGPLDRRASPRLMCGCTAAEYSNPPQRVPTQATLNMLLRLDFHQPSRSEPTVCIQKASVRVPLTPPQVKGLS